jgi:hypothetical protein
MEFMHLMLLEVACQSNILYQYYLFSFILGYHQIKNEGQSDLLD